MALHQEIHGDAGLVIGGDLINTSGREWPENLARSREQLRDCPRCLRLTWRDDRTCFHCRYDLVAHDDRVEEAAWEHAEERRRRHALKTCGLGLVAGLLLWKVAAFFPDSFANTVRAGGGIVFAVGIFALLSAGKRERQRS